MASAASLAFWSENRPKLIAFQKRGKSTAYIAAALGVSQSQVCNQLAALRASGTVTMPPAANKKVRHTSQSDDALTTAIANGLSIKSYAKSVGLSQDVVRRRVANLGLKSAHAVSIDLAVVKPAIVAARAANKSWRTIGFELGIAEASARRIAASMSLPMALPHQPKIINQELQAKRRQRRNAIKAAARARIASDRPPKPARVVKEVKVRAPQPPRAPKLVPPLPAPAAVRAPLPSFTSLDAKCEPVEIMDLKPSMCRWPADALPGGLMRYCGCRISLGSYCRAHAAKAHPQGKVADTPAWAAPRSGRGFAMQREARR